MIKDLEMGLGLDTFSNPYSGGENLNTEYNNIVTDSFGREKKRNGVSIMYNDTNALSGTRTSELFFWVENNLQNKRAWVFYDKLTGQIKIKEG